MNLNDRTNPAEYADIFTKRGNQYHLAMTSARQARDPEFKQLFTRYPCKPSEKIIDAPSGGAYLQDFLHRTLRCDSTTFINLEFTPGFSEAPLVVDPYGTWPIAQGWADRAVCLAASHHISNLHALLDNFYTHTRPGAVINLADVTPGGGIASFLDTFVDKHTKTGHRGIYRNFHSFAWPSWMDIGFIETRDCHWRFDSEESMLLFCQSLFGLEIPDKSSLRTALNHFIGVNTSKKAVELQWQLTYVDAIRK